MNHRVEYSLVFVSLGVFFLGASVYLFDRSSSDIYFIPEWWQFADGNPALFGTLGQYLPSFAHTYSFILLASALLTPWPIGARTICFSWCAVEAFFELTQINFFAAHILTILPDWFADWPILENVPGYFLLGRFDPFDLVCIGIGGTAAYFTIIFFNRIRRA